MPMRFDDPTRDDLLNAIMAFQPNTTSGSSNDPLVYWGEYGKASFDFNKAIRGQEGARTPAPTKKPLSEAQLEFYKWSPAELQDWGDFLAEIGYIDESDKGDYSTLLSAWNDVLGEAVGFTLAGKEIKPRDVAKLMAGTGMTASGGGSSLFSGSKSVTQTSTSLTDPTTAKAMVNKVLSNYLGRAANPDELSTLIKTLNAAEAANPSQTTMTTQYVDGEAVSQSSKTTGGVDQQQILTDQAMQMPDYGAYQAASTYFNALLGAIRSPV